MAGPEQLPRFPDNAVHERIGWAARPRGPNLEYFPFPAESTVWTGRWWDVITHGVDWIHLLRHTYCTVQYCTVHAVDCQILYIRRSFHPSDFESRVTFLKHEKHPTFPFAKRSSAPECCMYSTVQCSTAQYCTIPCGTSRGHLSLLSPGGHSHLIRRLVPSRLSPHGSSNGVACHSNQSVSPSLMHPHHAGPSRTMVSQGGR